MFKNLSFGFAFTGEELESIEKSLDNVGRKDYYHKCNNSELYTHIMTFKCSKCHNIILGGDE